MGVAETDRTRPGNISEAEWALRLQLADCYNLFDHLGWTEAIFNHISLRVPGPEHHFLMNPFGLNYDEVTASNLVKVDMDEDLDESAGVNRPGFTLHGGVLRGRPDVNCAVHVHTRTAPLSPWRRAAKSSPTRSSRPRAIEAPTCSDHWGCRLVTP